MYLHVIYSSMCFNEGGVSFLISLWVTDNLSPYLSLIKYIHIYQLMLLSTRWYPVLLKFYLEKRKEKQEFEENNYTCSVTKAETNGVKHSMCD